MTWILLITAVIALAGSGLSMGIQPVDEGIDAWQSAVKSVVKDNDKKKAAVAFIEKVREESTARRAELGDAMAAYLKLEAGYNSTPEEVDQAIETLNKEWTEQETWLIDQRFELQELLTPEEWQEALSRVDKDLSGNWDALKTAQKTAREQYEKRLDKVEN